MNIVSQILSHETKNLLINQIVNFIKENIISTFDILLTNFSNYRYIQNILNLQRSINDSIKEAIIKFIELIDIEFKKSNKRKKLYYVNKSNVDRTIYTIFGEINFKRTLYITKDGNDYYFFIDDILGLEKYTLYDPIVRGIAINDAVNYNANNASYHSSLDSLDILNTLYRNNTGIISRQSIYRWIRDYHIKEINYEPIDNGSTLYVMADEKWIHKQDKLDTKNRKWIMSKCFIVFIGIKRKGNRNKLIGKHVFITTGKNAYKELMDEICLIYDFNKVKTINLLSDAGTWILSGKDELKLYSHNNIVVNTCEFHVKQKINRTTTDKDLREKLSKIIYENEDKDEFKNIMNTIIDIKEKQSRKDKISEYRDYILKHWKGIIAMKYSDVKSSMESHISHCVASKFGSRPKGYSDKYIQTYLKLQEALVNGINILDYYLKTYNQSDDIKYNEKEVNFSLFDTSTSNLPCLTTLSSLKIELNYINGFSI